ncbi:MAG: hypothetical protein OHK0039_45040 [Bacteroidia bacterium]
MWYAVLAGFYLGLCWVLLSYYRAGEDIRQLRVDEDLDGQFEGNDWVQWEDADAGIVAREVHPLQNYQPIDQNRIQQGDRLISLDYNAVTSAEVAEKITRAARPGHVFVAKVFHTDPYSMAVSKEEALIINGFRLSFTFNRIALYWHLSSWIAGLGAFAALVMLAILLPIARTQWRRHRWLLGIVVSALLWFLVQLLHHIYLIVESDLEHVGAEKLYILISVFLFFAYAISYFHFKIKAGHWAFVVPSVLAAVFLWVNFYQVIYVERQLRHYHDLLEEYTFIFFLLHLAGALLLHLAARSEPGALHWSSAAGQVLVALLAGLGIAYYALDIWQAAWDREHVLFLLSLLFFFPLVNATSLQLQFGKVSLVVTQTIQYLVAFIVSIIVYLLITQLFEYIRPNIQYRRLLEFVGFLIVIVILRLIYQANEDRLSRYFVSAQREQLNKLRAFIASISRYTVAEQLRQDLEKQLRDFFRTDRAHLSWKDESSGDTLLPDIREQLYHELAADNMVWSRTKEISPLRLSADLERVLLQSPFTLISPVKVDEDKNGLLLLGRKKSGVYNLSDLELISNLIQQTQLTVNVIHLNEREKSLMKQTYEANLTALRSQINPHFLFNTLNSIGELVHESADLAEQAVEKLAFIFRYTLKKSSQNFVPLGEEISLISTYLELEKIRFSDRLDVHISVDADVKDVQIPAFILSTLVENCIKHGISKILGKGLVSVEAFRDGDFLVCEVVDNGPGIDLTRIYKSTGLSNSIARLENIYDLKNLLYFENTGEGTYVRLKIPLVEHPQLT